MLTGERASKQGMQKAIRTLRGLNDTLEDRVTQRTQDLVRYQTQLRSLVSELILTEQRERRRIAGELHDHLAQLLVACKMKLAMLRNHGGRLSGALNDETQAVLADVEQFLDESLVYTRSLMAQISPVLLYEHGLMPAIHWLAERIMPRHGLTVTVREEAELHAEALSEDVRIMLFQSVRELLFNVLKHAGVDRAEVIVRRSGEGLEIIISDMGAGFPHQTVPVDDVEPKGFGLFSIRERMTLLGGRFELVSTPGMGTRQPLGAVGGAARPCRGTACPGLESGRPPAVPCRRPGQHSRDDRGRPCRGPRRAHDDARQGRRHRGGG